MWVLALKTKNQVGATLKHSETPEMIIASSKSN